MTAPEPEPGQPFYMPPDWRTFEAVACMRRDQSTLWLDETGRVRQTEWDLLTSLTR